MRRAILVGLAFGAGAVHLAVVGVLLMLHQRAIIVGTLSLGQAVLLLIAGGAGAMAGRPLPGLLAGAAAGVPIAVLTALLSVVPLQAIFIALSPALYDMLTLELGLAAGIGILIGVGAAAGLLGAALRISPVAVRRAIFPGAIAVAVAGVFQELIQLMLQQYEDAIGDFREFIYTWEGLGPQGAITIFILVALCSEVIGSVWRRRARVQTTTTGASA
jgi:branched-chain amino acid transport system permease protein